MTLQWTIDQGIGMLTLDQPPSNTMTLEFFREIRGLVHQLASTKNLKAIIISGNGRHYSSGADIGELLQQVDEDTMCENYRAFVILEQLKIPVISAIRGVCLGSAFELALFSHFRIAARDAVLGLPESTFNLMPGIGGIQRVAALTGKARAIEIIMRGLTFSAPEALEMNLVDASITKSSVFPLAVAFANTLPRDFKKANRKVCIYKFLKPLLDLEKH